MKKLLISVALLITFVTVHTTTVGQDTKTADSGGPPCATPEQLAALFSGTIVYEGDPVEGADPVRSFDIWIIGAPDWTPRLVSGEAGFDGHPAWSPDGRRIVYSAHGMGNADLYLIDPDGGNRTRLTSAEQRDDYPKWLSEGIVYKSGTQRQIIDPVSREIRPYEAVDPEVEGYTFSPNRKRMVFTKRMSNSFEIYHLFIARANGTIIRQLTNEHRREIEPHWSPVDNRIAYAGGTGGRTGKWDVYLLDLDTGEKKKLTRNRGADWVCGWSPNADWVLMTSEFGGNWDIYAIRPDGTNRIRITCHAGDARYASWTSAEPLAK